MQVNDKNQLEVINGGDGGDGKEYKAGKAFNLNPDDTFDVKADDTTIKVNDKNELTAIQPTIPTYTAGKALSLDANNKFDVSIDNSTIKLIDQNQLTAINEGKTYTAGDGIEIEDLRSWQSPNNNPTIRARVDGTTIKWENGILNVPQPTIPTYTAGNGLILVDNKFSTSVDGSTIKINDKNKLEAIGGGSSSYTAGDGIKRKWHTN